MKVTHPKYYLSNLTVLGWKLNSRSVDHKSDALTTTLPNHLKHNKITNKINMDKPVHEI